MPMFNDVFLIPNTPDGYIEQANLKSHVSEKNVWCFGHFMFSCVGTTGKISTFSKLDTCLKTVLNNLFKITVG